MAWEWIVLGSIRSVEVSGSKIEAGQVWYFVFEATESTRRNTTSL